MDQVSLFVELVLTDQSVVAVHHWIADMFCSLHIWEKFNSVVY